MGGLIFVSANRFIAMTANTNIKSSISVPILKRPGRVTTNVVIIF